MSSAPPSYTEIMTFLVSPKTSITTVPLAPPIPSTRKRIPSLTSPSALALLSIFHFTPFSSASFAKAPNSSPGAAWQPPVYVYPDPNAEFARAETEKFRVELLKRLSKNRGTFGGDIDAVVLVCTEIFSEFLHKEYGGPGTFIVEPFTDMLLSLKEKKLQGAPVAARAALLWAQNCVDRDWEIWTSQQSK